MADFSDLIVTEPESCSVSEIDIGALISRIGFIENKIDRILKAVEKDVNIDESNNDKISTDEAIDKINENEEYKDSTENEDKEN